MKLFLSAFLGLCVFSSPAVRGEEHVILLHGLLRSARSMTPLEYALSHQGYVVHNIGYPSRRACVRELSQIYVAPVVEDCQRRGASEIHFVTHSLGGIIVRAYAVSEGAHLIGRVVMLGPPNQGSEVVDHFGALKLFRSTAGPAGSELGTTDGDIPSQLGPVRFPLGIVAGSKSINPLLSLLIPGRDDGKVAVSRTAIEGMGDHITLPCSHPLLVSNKESIAQVCAFLQSGRFHRASDRDESVRHGHRHRQARTRHLP